MNREFYSRQCKRVQDLILHSSITQEHLMVVPQDVCLKIKEEKTRWLPMTEESCFYHTEKTAQATCRICLRPICPEDQVESKHLRTNTMGKVVREPILICKLCDLNKKIRARNAYANLLVAIVTIAVFIPLSIGIGFIIVAVSGWRTLIQTQNYNFMVIAVLTPLFILGIMVVLFLPFQMSKRKQIVEVTGRKKLTTLKKERREFLGSVTSTKARKILQQKQTTKNSYCYNCGERILDKEAYCGQCGNPYKENYLADQIRLQVESQQTSPRR